MCSVHILRWSQGTKAVKFMIFQHVFFWVLNFIYETICEVSNLIWRVVFQFWWISKSSSPMGLDSQERHFGFRLLICQSLFSSKDSFSLWQMQFFALWHQPLNKEICKRTIAFFCHRRRTYPNMYPLQKWKVVKCDIITCDT